ncbi:hypothetical protein LXA43DRAFT_1102793 [Ganoderma leucocontextum]|nr:hypothetical protein LXA43DRAFT_1102793 [Ganoderma leucocontextum]
MDPSANTAVTVSNPLAGLPQLPDGATMDNTYGAMLLGTFFLLILYGVLLHQTYSYLRVHSADSRWIKCYVALILSLDTAHSVVVMSMWPLAVVTVVIAVNIVACQSFFAYRVYRIGRKSRMVVWLCMVCQGVGFGLCIAFTVKAWVPFEVLYPNPTFPDAITRFESALWQALSDSYASWISIALGFTVFIDTALAAVLVFVLHHSRTGVKSTNSLLDTLIAYAVTTGLLTDVINILGFVFALVSSQNLYYAALNTLVSRAVYNGTGMPREPVWSQCTGVYDATAELISLPEAYRLPQGKDLSNAPFSVIDIMAEKEFTRTRDSDDRLSIHDLERGEEPRQGL